MRRIVLAVSVAALAGCRSVPMGQASGASSPRGAVELMLASAKAQDLQGISSVWGDETGLVRDRLGREEVESRTFIMACVLKSDSQKFGDPIQAGAGRILIQVDLTQGTNSASTRFETARTKDGRWLVANVDLPSLQNKGFCAR